MILVGEVYTGLLRNSSAVTAGAAAALLALKPGVRARHGERPVSFAISPDLLTGVDCQLASTQAMPRGIGTVSSRATIIGGHVLQGSSHAEIVGGLAQRRLPWSHYLARPGEVEVIGRIQEQAMGEGFLGAPVPPATLDLGSINARLVKRIHGREGIDQRFPFRAQATRVRWIAGPVTDSGPSVSFSVEPDAVRTIRVRSPISDRAELVGVCEDIALHDWLLTVVNRLVDHSRIGAAPRREVIVRLLPALDYLLHLWMPGARLGDETRSIWRGLEQRPGFTKQWQASVDRIRDQLALATITRLLGPNPFDHS